MTKTELSYSTCRINQNNDDKLFITATHTDKQGKLNAYNVCALNLPDAAFQPSNHTTRNHNPTPWYKQFDSECVEFAIVSFFLWPVFLTVLGCIKLYEKIMMTEIHFENRSCMIYKSDYNEFKKRFSKIPPDELDDKTIKADFGKFIIDNFDPDKCTPFQKDKCLCDDNLMPEWKRQRTQLKQEKLRQCILSGEFDPAKRHVLHHSIDLDETIEVSIDEQSKLWKVIHPDTIPEGQTVKIKANGTLLSFARLHNQPSTEEWLTAHGAEKASPVQFTKKVTQHISGEIS